MFKKLILDKKSSTKALGIIYRLSPKKCPTHLFTWRRKVRQRWGLKNKINEGIVIKKTPPMLST
jgi:hypothetical protein